MQFGITKGLDMKTVEKILGAEIHYLASMFPLMEGQEFEELVASIEKHGVQQPIVVARVPSESDRVKKPYLVVDGRNRLRAIEVLIKQGKKLPGYLHQCIDTYNTLDEDNLEEIREYIIAANINRRHLSDDQRVQLLAKVMGRQVRAEAVAAKAASPAAAGKASGKARTNVAQKVGPRSKAEKHASSAAGRIATAAKVNRLKAADALAIAEAAEKDPEIAKEQEAVIAGARPIREAVKKVKPAAKKPAAARKKKEDASDGPMPKASMKEICTKLFDAVAQWKESGHSVEALAEVLKELLERCK